MNILVTICARGGSKGVPGKNIRNLLGKPLIAYSITQAKSWERAMRIIVSTDSKDIAAVAKDFGAEVPFERPKDLASDTADKLAVIHHAVLESEKIFNEKYDIVVDLDATSPLRTTKDLENCYQLFLKEKPENLFSVVPSHKNPYFNMVELDRNGRAHLSKSLTHATHRRQDAPKVYDMNASIYFYSRNFFLKENTSVITDNSIVYCMPDVSGFDIDREIDFHFVEFLIEKGYTTL